MRGVPPARSAASLVLFGVLVVGANLYTATGGSSRELLVQELLVNLILVLGLQAFTGLTGILSFGHLAFAQLAAYGTAIVAIPVATKATSLPELPFGLGDVHLGSVAATAVGVLVATVLGAVVGIAVARAGGLAATMITLAVLFVVDQVVKNWQELTKGAGGLSGIPRHTTNTWFWIAALVALIARVVVPRDAPRALRHRHARGRDRRAGDRDRPVLAAVDGVGRQHRRRRRGRCPAASSRSARPTRSSTRSTSACCCWRCSSSAGCAP